MTASIPVKWGRAVIPRSYAKRVGLLGVVIGVN